MKKKLFVIFGILIVVFLVGLLFIMNKNSEKIILKQSEFVFELGENISGDVSYYLDDTATKNTNEYKITSNDLKNVNNYLVINNSEVVDVGDYTITIVYKNLSESLNIKVIDSTKPEFTKFEERIELIATSDKKDLISYFEASDLSNVDILIEGDYDTTKSGEYKINVIATDKNGNSVRKESLVIVKEQEKPKETSVTKKENNNQSSSNGSNNSSTTTSKEPVKQPETTSRFRRDIADSYVRQVNTYRKNNGLSELPITSEAQAEADRRVKEIISNFSHDGAGYGFGEIIGEGSIGIDFIQAWKNSPSHNASMLREQNVAMAASVYEHNNYWYAVISFRMNY